MTQESRRVRRALDSGIAIVMRQLQLRVYQAVTSGTPVLTGFARGGWSPTTGSPDESQEEIPSNVEEATRRAAELFASNTQRAERIAATYTLNQGPVFLSNNVVYLPFLNQGTSAQAPAMFVEMAVADGVQATLQALRRIG